MLNGTSINLLVFCDIGFKIFISDSGEQVVMVTSSIDFYLWEMGLQTPQWWKLFPPEKVLLPESSYKEVNVDAGFYVHQVYNSIKETLMEFNPFLKYNS